MKFLLKVLAAPIVLLLAILGWTCSAALYISSYLFGLASTLVGLLGIAVLVTYSPRNGCILLAIAFLVSPIGIPMVAAWLVGQLQVLRYTIQSYIYG